MLEVVEPGVVGVCVGSTGEGDLPRRSHDAIEVGLKVVPVARRLGPAPHVGRLGHQAREVRLELDGHAQVLLTIALQDLDLKFLHLAEEVS